VGKEKLSNDSQTKDPVDKTLGNKLCRDFSMENIFGGGTAVHGVHGPTAVACELTLYDITLD